MPQTVLNINGKKYRLNSAVKGVLPIKEESLEEEEGEKKEKAQRVYS